MTGNSHLHIVVSLMGTEAVLGVTLFKYRRKIAAFVQKWRQSDNILAIWETVLLFTAAAVSSLTDLWKLTTWSEHPIRVQYAFSLVISLSAWALITKLFRESLKEAVKSRVEELEHGLAKEREDRDRRLLQNSQIRKLIDRKLDRFRELAKRDAVAPEEVIEAWNPSLQVFTVLKSMHEFFLLELRRKKPSGRLRLGLYLPDREMNSLVIRYSWDGERDGCIGNHPEHMRLVSAAGSTSEIVRTFHLRGDHEIGLVPDCAGDRSFRFWDEEQPKYLRSLLCLKYQLQLDGMQSALVLSLDCDEPNFFSSERAEEFRTYVVEMLIRVEYELVSAELRSKFQNPLPSHEQRSPAPRP
jgi:hypothetical protein